MNLSGPDFRVHSRAWLPRAAEDAAAGPQLLGDIHEHQREGARHRDGCDQAEDGYGATVL